MDITQIFIASAILVLIGLLVWGRWSVVTIFASVAFSFYLTGLISFEALARQLVNPGLVTVVLLMLVATVLDKVRLLELWVKRLLSGSPRWAMLKLLAAVGLYSPFLNNTAVVASLIGPLKSVSKENAPKLLLPMTYASTLGGVTTLIGTSTNLLVAGFVVAAGLPELNIFTPLPVGILLFVACVGVMVLSHPLILRTQATDTATYEHYLIQAVVSDDSPLIGRNVEDNGLNGLDVLRLVEIVRPDQLIAPVRPQQVVRAGDVLVFAGDPGRLDLLAGFPGLQIHGHGSGVPTENLLRVVVSGESNLIGQRLREIDLRTQFDASLIAVRHVTRRSRPRGYQPKRIRAGDMLVLAAGRDFENRNNLARNFIPLSRPIVQKFTKPWKSALALGGFAMAVVAAAFGWLPFIKGLTILLAVFLASGLVTASELRRNVPWQLIITIGSALIISHVLTTSGLAELVAQNALATIGSDPRMAFYVILVLTALLTETMTNNAAAALMFPISLSASIALGVDHMPFVMAVIFGASASFLTPHAYQTNLMVMSPGGYKPRDYLKAGAPVSLTYLVLAALLVPLFFPF